MIDQYNYFNRKYFNFKEMHNRLFFRYVGNTMNEFFIDEFHATFFLSNNNLKVLRNILKDNNLKSLRTHKTFTDDGTFFRIKIDIEEFNNFLSVDYFNNNLKVIDNKKKMRM